MSIIGRSERAWTYHKATDDEERSHHRQEQVESVCLLLLCFCSLLVIICSLDPLLDGRKCSRILGWKDRFDELFDLRD